MVAALALVRSKEKEPDSPQDSDLRSRNALKEKISTLEGKGKMLFLGSNPEVLSYQKLSLPATSKKNVKKRKVQGQKVYRV